MVDEVLTPEGEEEVIVPETSGEEILEDEISEDEAESPSDEETRLAGDETLDEIDGASAEEVV